MMINFEEMEAKVLPNFRGGEKAFITKMVDDGKNKIMYGRLEPGASIGLHTHETDCEIIYFLEGRGKMLYDDGEEEVKAGLCHYCPKGHSHSLINDSDADLVFFATVPAQ